MDPGGEEQDPRAHGTGGMTRVLHRNIHARVEQRRAADARRPFDERVAEERVLEEIDRASREHHDA